jgi:hypothetical protein
MLSNEYLFNLGLPLLNRLGMSLILLPLLYMTLRHELILSSWDAALAVQSIFTHCNVNGQVGGSLAANGNGDLIVHVMNKNYVLVWG